MGSRLCWRGWFVEFVLEGDAVVILHAAPRSAEFQVAPLATTAGPTNLVSSNTVAGRAAGAVMRARLQMSTEAIRVGIASAGPEVVRSARWQVESVRSARLRH